MLGDFLPKVKETKYYCEICGAPVDRPRYYDVDGAIMILCPRCAKYGKPIPRAVRPVMSVAKKPKRRPLIIKSRSKSLDEELGYPELVEDYGLRIKRAREARGWTQEDLARALRESVSFIRKIESQKIVPPDYLINRIEKLLNIKIRSEAEIISIQLDREERADEDTITLGDILIIKKPKKKSKKQ